MPTLYPSFKALHGRLPIAGEDYPKDASLCQDDHDFLSGTGQYSDDAPLDAEQAAYLKKELAATSQVEVPARATITPVSDMILALRNGLVMYWALAVKLDPNHLMQTYSRYCIALDALDSDMPNAVTTLEQAVPIFHAAIKMLEPNQAATS